MVIVEDGVEFTPLPSFNDLKATDVFSSPTGVYMKTAQGTMVNLKTGMHENYNGAQVRPHPEAVLILDGKKEITHRPHKKPA